MTDSSVYPTGEEDQDAEPTMTAPSKGRPDGTVADTDSDSQTGPHATEGPDQQGAEQGA